MDEPRGGPAGRPRRRAGGLTAARGAPTARPGRFTLGGEMARDAEDRLTPAERLLAAKLPEDATGPHEVSRRSLQAPRTLEGYFRGSAPPRWMERVAAVDRGIARERARLAEAREALARECAGDPERVARRWRETVAGWAFDEELNELIRRHNEWYPIERRLPVDLRTRDYVLVNGRSHRRPVLDADWALAEFPPELG